MSPNKSTIIGLFEITVEDRAALLKLTIQQNKREYIQNQTQKNLLTVLKECRKDLDSAESRMVAQLGKNKSSLFSFFSSSKQVVPAEAVAALTAEFETARRLLLEVSNAIIKDADETNLVARATSKGKHFESDIKKLKDGGRLERFWNDTEEEDLSANEIQKRKELGAITKPKIFHILADLEDVLTELPIRMQNFLNDTQERIANLVDKHTEATYKEFATSPLGEFIVELVELKNKTARMQAQGKPQDYIDSSLRKIAQNVEAAKANLGDVDLEKAEQIEKYEFNSNHNKNESTHISKLDILTVGLPDDRFSEFIHQIKANILMQDKAVEKDASRYRRMAQ